MLSALDVGCWVEKPDLSFDLRVHQFADNGWNKHDTKNEMLKAKQMDRKPLLVDEKIGRRQIYLLKQLDGPKDIKHKEKLSTIKILPGRRPIIRACSQ